MTILASFSRVWRAVHAALLCLLVHFLVCVGATSAQLPSSEEQISARFEFRFGAALPVVEQGEIALDPLDERLTPRTIRVTGKSFVETMLPPGTRWRISARIPAFWTPVTEVEIPATGFGILHRIFLWPAAFLEGRLQVPVSAPIPSQLNLQAIVALPGNTDLPAKRVEIACDVDREGRWHCPAPATKLVLRLDAPGLTPRTLPETTLREGQTFDFGPVVLIADEEGRDPLPGLPTTEATAALRLSWQLDKRGQVPELQGKLRLARQGQLVEFRVKDDKPAMLHLPANSVWELSTDLKGLWRPSLSISVGAAGSITELPVKLWRSAVVEGHWALADPSQSPPQQMRIETSPPPRSRQSSQPPAAIVPCTMDDQRTFRCTVAAGQQDLILRADGFVAHYFWDQRLSAAEALSLGKVQWIAGASLVGRVVAEDGEIDPRLCQVRLLRQLANGKRTRSSERLARTGATGILNERGFFQIGGIAPGTYVLEVTHPGFAPAEIAPVQILTASESSITEDLVLRHPRTLEIVVQPATALSSRPWRIEVDRAARFSNNFTEVYAGPADEQGHLRLVDLPPAMYRVTILDPAGNRLYSNYHVEVGSEADTIHEIDLDLTLIEGKLRYDGEPLEASLFFGGFFGAVRVQMDSDSEGNFAGMLPRDGRWKVEVKSQSPPIETQRDIKIHANRYREAKPRIDLPVTEVYGRVVDERGQAVAVAQVSLATSESNISMKVDHHGEFRFLAVPEGTVALSAEALDRFSSETRLEVFPDQTYGPLELRLQDLVDWSGQVVSPRGPVVGAGLDLTFGDQFSNVTSVRTGLDGRFTARIPAQAQRVHAVISPPGYTLTTAMALASEEATFRVTQEGGTLRLRVPFEPGEHTELPQLLLIWRDGEVLSPNDLNRWAQGHGMRYHLGHELRVPKVATGQYRACLGPRSMARFSSLERWLAEVASCASGYLIAGSELVLELNQK